MEYNKLELLVASLITELKDVKQRLAILEKQCNIKTEEKPKDIDSYLNDKLEKEMKKYDPNNIDRFLSDFSILNNKLIDNKFHTLSKEYNIKYEDIIDKWYILLNKNVLKYAKLSKQDAYNNYVIQLKEFGVRLLTPIYKNASTSYDYLCKQNHIKNKKPKTVNDVITKDKKYSCIDCKKHSK